MKKLKKYVLMIPLLAVMLLNCVCYGQVIAADATFPVFLEPSEFALYDFSDVDTLLSDSHLVNNSKEYYFTCAFMSSTDYNNFLSGGNYSITLYMFYPKSLSDYVQNDDVIMYKISQGYKATFKYTASSDSFNAFDSCSGFSGAFYYDKTNGSVKYDTMIYSLPSSLNEKTFLYEYYYFFQGSNIPDFPLVHDYSASQSAMNVNVTFSPELTGAFNRTVTDRDQKVTLDEFSFTVENNSKFDVQYLMVIYRDGDSFLPFNSDPLAAQTDTTFNGKTFTGSAVYVYVKDEWLYLPHGQQGIITGYAPSSWHKVSSGSSDLVSINFNQLKLEQYTNYNVCVYAVRNDLNYVTPFTNLNTFQYPACNDYHIELDNMQKVYSSSFTIINPATFDPNNNDNSYAYDADDRLLFNRANGYIDDNGEIVIDKVDTNQWVNAGNDPDDPWRGWDSDNDAWESYYKNQNTVSSDIDQLSNNFSSFFKFVNKIFSYFPKNYQNIIMLGLTSIVVLAVIKVVF